MNRSRPYASIRPLTVPTTTTLCQKRKKKEAKCEQYVVDSSNAPMKLHFPHTSPEIFRNVCIDTFNPFQLCKHQYGWC